MSLLTAAPEHWLDWNSNPLQFWKFGLPYAVLNLSEYCLHFVLVQLGLSPVAALHLAMKAPTIAAVALAGPLLARLTRCRTFDSRYIGVLWLLSPVPFWVAAIHGQIEPVAIMLLVAALIAWKEEAYLGAGLLAAAATSFEFFPLVFLVAPLLALVRDRTGDSTRAAIKGLLGFGIGLAACFGQVFVSAIDRHFVVDGLYSTQRTTSAYPVKNISVWYVWHLWHLSPWLPSHWLVVFAAGSLMILVVVARSKRLNRIAASHVAIALILLLSVVLEPESLPQFAAITLVALLLLNAEGFVPPVFVAVLPALEVAAYFFQISWYQYVTDIYPAWSSHLGSLLPTFPVNNRLSDVAGVASAFGIILVVTRTLEGLGGGVARVRPAPRRRQVPLVGLMSAVTTLFLVALALQPRLVQNVFGSSPSDFFDAQYLIDTQVQTVAATRVATDEFVVTGLHGALVEVADTRGRPAVSLVAVPRPGLAGLGHVDVRIGGRIQRLPPRAVGDQWWFDLSGVPATSTPAFSPRLCEVVRCDQLQLIVIWPQRTRVEASQPANTGVRMLAALAVLLVVSEFAAAAFVSRSEDLALSNASRPSPPTVAAAEESSSPGRTAHSHREEAPGL